MIVVVEAIIRYMCFNKKHVIKNEILISAHDVWWEDCFRIESLIFLSSCLVSSTFHTCTWCLMFDVISSLSFDLTLLNGTKTSNISWRSFKIIKNNLPQAHPVRACCHHGDDKSHDSWFDCCFRQGSFHRWR